MHGGRGRLLVQLETTLGILERELDDVTSAATAALAGLFAALRRAEYLNDDVFAAGNQLRSALYAGRKSVQRNLTQHREVLGALGDLLGRQPAAELDGSPDGSDSSGEWRRRTLLRMRRLLHQKASQELTDSPQREAIQRDLQRVNAELEHARGGGTATPTRASTGAGATEPGETLPVGELDTPALPGVPRHAERDSKARVPAEGSRHTSSGDGRGGTGNGSSGDGDSGGGGGGVGGVGDGGAVQAPTPVATHSRREDVSGTPRVGAGQVRSERPVCTPPDRRGTRRHGLECTVLRPGPKGLSRRGRGFDYLLRRIESGRKPTAAPTAALGASPHRGRSGAREVARKKAEGVVQVGHAGGNSKSPGAERRVAEEAEAEAERGDWDESVESAGAAVLRGMPPVDGDAAGRTPGPGPCPRGARPRRGMHVHFEEGSAGAFAEEEEEGGSGNNGGGDGGGRSLSGCSDLVSPGHGSLDLTELRLVEIGGGGGGSGGGGGGGGTLAVSPLPGPVPFPLFLALSPPHSPGPPPPPPPLVLQLPPQTSLPVVPPPLPPPRWSPGRDACGARQRSGTGYGAGPPGHSQATTSTCTLPTVVLLEPSPRDGIQAGPTGGGGGGDTARGDDGDVACSLACVSATGGLRRPPPAQKPTRTSVKPLARSMPTVTAAAIVTPEETRKSRPLQAGAPWS